MTAPTCPDCGAELVAQRTPTRMAWRPTDIAWCEGERVHWGHRAGTACEPRADDEGTKTSA